MLSQELTGPGGSLKWGVSSMLWTYKSICTFLNCDKKIHKIEFTDKKGREDTIPYLLMKNRK